MLFLSVISTAYHAIRLSGLKVAIKLTDWIDLKGLGSWVLVLKKVLITSLQKKIGRLVQAALSYQRKPSGHFLRHVVVVVVSAAVTSADVSHHHHCTTSLSRKC